MEVEFKKHGIGNREDYDDFVRDDEEGALDFVGEVWVLSPTWIEGIRVGSFCDLL